MTSEEKETACDQLDEHGFYKLPTSFDIRGYDIMEDFVYSLPGPAREKLRRAISGQGAFRRFIDHPQINVNDKLRLCFPAV